MSYHRQDGEDTVKIKFKTNFKILLVDDITSSSDFERAYSSDMSYQIWTFTRALTKSMTRPLQTHQTCHQNYVIGA